MKKIAKFSIILSQLSLFLIIIKSYKQILHKIKYNYKLLKSPLAFGVLALFIVNNASADNTGAYIGGGIGYGIQALSLTGTNVNEETPLMRAMLGYQFASFIGAEAGYTYFTQSQNLNSLGNVSTTVYDLAFTPGFTLPASPVTIYTRLGIDTISSNLNTNWYNQVFSNSSANFEWGAGVKLDIPTAPVFVRLEYVDYGSALNNNNSSLTVHASAVLLNAAYLF